MTAGAILLDFYRYNTWATLRLLEACEALSDEQLALPTAAGTIAHTLTHLVAAEGRYVTTLGGPDDPTPLRDSGDFPGIVALRGYAERSGAALEPIVAAASRDHIVRRVRDGKTFEIESVVILGQVLEHAIEHRAHVQVTMGQHGLNPPDLQSWAWALEKGLYREATAT